MKFEIPFPKCIQGMFVGTWDALAFGILSEIAQRKYSQKSGDT